MPLFVTNSLQMCVEIKKGLCYNEDENPAAGHGSGTDFPWKNRIRLIAGREKEETKRMADAEVDVLIIGAGPAGCSAALTLRQRGKTVLLAHAGESALEKARQVDNYPGLPAMTGREMMAQFRRQALDAGASIREGLVQRVLPMGKTFSAMLGNELIACRSVLIATGAPKARPLPGEAELVGQGVSYCATCDGMFYRGKEIAVLGGWPEAAQEANFLSELGRVTYYSLLPHDASALRPAIEKAAGKPQALARQGDKILLTAGTENRAFDGVFILRPAMAMDQLMPEIRAENGRIVTDDQGRATLHRVCAAGDAAGMPYQVAKAVGDGCRAALSLVQMLDETEA